MEQATNTFSKGLQMDTNPMVQGTDTLTDCLNGTLITMNGNEVILQNDMGNRRVNNAFLPSGYEPVGIKEYGGIIYVAAYNPITNKSQIGSFPSPQRKIDTEFSEENSNLLSGEFYLENFFNKSNIEEDTFLGINILKSDSFLVPLSNDVVLRAGDKFSIYSPDLYNLDNVENNITNFNNIATDGTKRAYSPKNKKYTLAVGILNSQNEFVDITKTLCRWKINDGQSEMQTYDSSYSEIYKFNDGYFIAKEFNNENFTKTDDDAKLIKTRQKIATNTYAYKLVGPLYLKATLNHIEGFNYTIRGIYSEDDGATLEVSGYITYNCNDGSDNSIENSNEDYQTFEEGKPNFNGFDLINPITKDILQGSVKIGESVYNPDTNTYSVKIVKTYTGVRPNIENSNIFNFIIGVNAGENLYLKQLSTKGSIDFSLLGSGRIYFTEWRFLNNPDENKTTLTYSLEVYPTESTIFKNLKFTFTDITTLFEETPESYVYDNNLEVVSGRNTIDIEWNASFKSRSLYQVKATYDIYDADGTTLKKENEVIEDIQGYIQKYEESPIINNDTYILRNPIQDKWVSTSNYECQGKDKYIIQEKYRQYENGMWKKIEGVTRSHKEENSPDCGCYRWKATYITNFHLENSVVVPDTQETVIVKDEPSFSTTLAKLERQTFAPEILVTNHYEDSITSIEFGSSGVTSLGRFFDKSNQLESVIIRSGIKTIEKGAFHTCLNLNSVKIEEGLEEIQSEAFNNCQSLVSIVIPHSVKKLGHNIFARCPNLETIVIGSGVKNIGRICGDSDNQNPLNSTLGAVYTCNLKDIYCFAEIPPTLEKFHSLQPLGNDFSNEICTNKQGLQITLHVPGDSINSYRNKPEWNNAYAIVGIADGEEENFFGVEIEEGEENNSEEHEEYEEEFLETEEISNNERNNCRWILTTPLFNDFYSSILDFCTTKNQEFLSKMNIHIDINNEDRNPIIIEQIDSPKFSGNLLSNQIGSNIKWDVKKQWNINKRINSTGIISLSNNLYPSYTDIESTELQLEPDNYQLLFLKDGAYIPATNENFKIVIEEAEGTNISNETREKWNNTKLFDSKICAVR